MSEVEVTDCTSFDKGNISYASPCLICGEGVPVPKYYFSPQICDSCRAAILELKMYIAKREEV